MKIYEGFFFENEFSGNQFVGSLDRTIKNQHITTAFKPEVPNADLYGEYADFQIIGYGNDGKNEGFEVKLVRCDNIDLVNIYDKIAVPHITVSVSKDGKPVDTAKLKFHGFYGKTITLKFGAFNMETGEIDFGDYDFEYI